MKDGYSTARVQLHQDHPIEQEEFDGLLNLTKKEFIPIICFD